MTTVRQPVVQIQSRRRARQSPCGLQVRWYGMGCDLLVKLRTEDNDVVADLGQRLLIAVLPIPEPRFAHEIEARLLEDGSRVELVFGAEEDRSSEDPLKGCDKPPVLGSALAHAEHVEHFRSRREANGGGLLSRRERGKEDRH